MDFCALNWHVSSVCPANRRLSIAQSVNRSIAQSLSLSVKMPLEMQFTAQVIEPLETEELNSVIYDLGGDSWAWLPNT